MGKKIRSRNIAFNLAVVFVCFAVFQSVLLTGIMVGSGVLTRAKQNEYRIFSEKVNGQKNNLENEMENIWTNFEYDTERMSRYLESMDNPDISGRENEVLEALAPTVLDALFHTKTTGAFLILPDEGKTDNSLAALYFRNNNPEKAGEDNANVYMLTGPWNVAETMEIATTANWSFRLNLTDGNRNFFDKPYEAAMKYGRSGWLGYWSLPFRVNPQDEEVITYSIPLFGDEGKVAAVFGVEISVNYMYSFLPANDLQSNGSYGYAIATGSMEDGLELSVTHGAVQKRMLDQGGPLKLECLDEQNGIYRLLNHNSNHGIYACISQMGMYYHNTPFENEGWYLMGMMEEPVLLHFPKKIEKILVYALVMSTAIGLIIAVFVSMWFTRHAKLMELSELPLGVFEIRSHSGGVFMTSQVPGLLGLTREQERNFTRDKTKFAEFLKNLESSGEDGIFKVNNKAGGRWLKITRRSADGTVRCVVEDVTDEVLQTKALKVERDRDGLTGVKNRLAFEKKMEHIRDDFDGTGKIGFVMCDLNDLKSVNDRYGHDMGDEYIRTAAKAIQDAFPSGRVYRIGGDEFAVYLEESDAAKAVDGIGTIKKLMEEYSRTREFNASIASGYAFYTPGRDMGPKDVLSRADAYMYRNKRRLKGKTQR